MGLLDRAVERLKAEKDAEEIVERQAPGASSPSPQSAPDPAADAPPGDVPRVPEPAADMRIDLAGLAANGFLVPGFPADPALLDEFRRIKRELLVRVALENTDETQPTPANLIMVTSAIDGEGKTFVSTNLALSIALEVDQTALLIDGDVIRRGTSRLLGLGDRAGLMDYLDGTREDLSELMVAPQGIDKLRILPAGTRHEHVNELLASERMREVMEELAFRDPDRIVIVDSPPLLLTSEAAVLAQHMGQILLVVRADHTPTHQVDHALAAIDPERFSGIILNQATRNLAADGYGDYGYD